MKTMKNIEENSFGQEYTGILKKDSGSRKFTK